MEADPRKRRLSPKRADELCNSKKKRCTLLHANCFYTLVDIGENKRQGTDVRTGSQCQMEAAPLKVKVEPQKR
jgi:hypothetical protein